MLLLKPVIKTTAAAVASDRPGSPIGSTSTSSVRERAGEPIGLARLCSEMCVTFSNRATALRSRSVWKCRTG